MFTQYFLYSRTDLDSEVVNFDETGAFDANNPADTDEWRAIGQGADKIVAAWGNCGENTGPAKSIVIRKKAEVARWLNENFPNNTYIVGDPTNASNPAHPRGWVFGNGELNQQEIPFNPRHD